VHIRLINPNSTASMTNQALESALRVASAGTHVSAVNPTRTPVSIEGSADEALAVPDMLSEIRKGEEQGVDAYVIACFDDTGLDAARSLADAPVIGIGEAACHMASLIGGRFSVVTTLSRSVPILEQNLVRSGLDGRCGRVRAAEVPVLALEKTAAAIRDDGEELAANLYLLVGGAMAGTRPVPVQAIDRVGEAVVGGRRLRLLALDGHTDADLALLDERSGVLFAGDLAFLDRAPTTPNADIDHWLAALDALQKLRFTMLVPGHGPIVNGPQAIAQTRDYLAWARQSLQASAARGLDMNEAMREPLPERFRAMGVAEEEWRRTVSHLYPDIELEALPVR